MLIEVPVARIPKAWEALMAILRPAVEMDPVRTSWDLLFALMEGRMTAWVVETDDARGAIVTRIADLEGVTPRVTVGWIYYAAGNAGPMPRRVMRAALAEFEQIAVGCGCDEVRFGGRRGWQRVFPDYEAFGSVGNLIDMRKSLN